MSQKSDFGIIRLLPEKNITSKLFFFFLITKWGLNDGANGDKWCDCMLDCGTEIKDQDLKSLFYSVSTVCSSYSAI